MTKRPQNDDDSQELAAKEPDASAETVGLLALCERLPARAAEPELHSRASEISAIVDGLGLGAQLSCAARIYPYLKAGILSNNELEKAGGREFVSLCGELRQLFELSLPRQWLPGESLPNSQAEALRRMLLAVVNDYRLVIVRIAALLVDLRAARNAKDSVKRALALDTREIFAPLASRLGIWQLKWELEDYAFRYLQPDDYQRIAKQLDGRRSEREQYIAQITAELQRLMHESGIEAQISGRPKHIYSIWRKMQRKQLSLDELYDVRAMRILVDTVTQCYTALGVVHNRWPYIREEFDDYIANPKGNDYRSLHTAVFGPGGEPVEIQIRTHEMHQQAELGVAAHWRYKEGGPSAGAFEQKIAWLRQLLDADSSSTSTDMLDSLSEGLFDDRVYAITPKGDIIDLQAGATPLDFAYQVHTQIGHRCRGARANGRIVPLNYCIANGDRIEIITAKEPQPSRDWLSERTGFLVSARNRGKVRNWFRQQDRELNKKQGRELIERELQRLHIRDLSVARLASAMKFDDVDSLCVALGAGDVTSAALVNAASQLLAPSEPQTTQSKPPRRHKATGGGAVTIDGAGSVMTQFAGCCNPVAPESILGYITVGRGVSIHRRDCSSMKRLRKQHPERIIDVRWSDDERARYPVTVRVDAFDRNGLLKDVTAVLSDEDIRILSSDLKVDEKSMRTTIGLRIEVRSLNSLSSALNKLALVTNVERVSRSS